MESNNPLGFDASFLKPPAEHTKIKHSGKQKTTQKKNLTKFKIKKKNK